MQHAPAKIMLIATTSHLRTLAAEIETVRLTELFPNSDSNAYTARLAAYSTIARMSDAEVRLYLAAS